MPGRWAYGSPAAAGEVTSESHAGPGRRGETTPRQTLDTRKALAGAGRSPSRPLPLGPADGRGGGRGAFLRGDRQALTSDSRTRRSIGKEATPPRIDLRPAGLIGAEGGELMKRAGAGA